MLLRRPPIPLLKLIPPLACPNKIPEEFLAPGYNILKDSAKGVTKQAPPVDRFACLVRDQSATLNMSEFTTRFAHFHPLVWKGYHLQRANIPPQWAWAVLLFAMLVIVALEGLLMRSLESFRRITLRFTSKSADYVAVSKHICSLKPHCDI